MGNEEQAALDREAREIARFERADERREPAEIER